MSDKHEVGKYLKIVLDNARENHWDDFSRLVYCLASLEDEGFRLSDKKSRFGHTYPFRIQERILDLQEGFLINLEENIESLSFKDVRKSVSNDMKTSYLFNNYNMYAPYKFDKIQVEDLKEMILYYGVQFHLERFSESGELSELTEAELNSELIGRNFPREVKNYLGISEYELSVLI